MKDITYKEILASLAVIIVLYFIFKRSKAKKQEAELQELTGAYTSASDAFNENYFAHVLSKFRIKPANYLSSKGFLLQNIIDIADEIHDTKGFFNDDEERLYNIFASLKTKVIVSIVATRFKQKYGVRLLSFLQNFMNTNEMAKLLSIVKRLKDK